MNPIDPGYLSCAFSALCPEHNPQLFDKATLIFLCSQHSLKGGRKSTTERLVGGQGQLAAEGVAESALGAAALKMPSQLPCWKKEWPRQAVFNPQVRSLGLIWH